MSEKKKDGFTREPCPLARCKKATSNTYAGELLYQIGYKFASKSALQYRHGKYWCAQSGTQWRNEMCFTVEQYKTAIRELKKSGLVEHRTERFNDNQLFKITWLRPSNAGQAFLMSIGNWKSQAWKTPSVGVENASQQASMTPDDGVKSPSTGNSNSGNLTKGKGSKSLAGGEGEIGEPEQEETVAGAEKGSHAAAATVVSKKEIEAAWIAAHEKHRPDLAISPFCGADWNFAHQIASRLGLNAAAIIDKVIRDWKDFTYFVAKQASYHKAPGRPTLAYLATFGVLARDFEEEPPLAPDDDLMAKAKKWDDGAVA